MNELREIINIVNSEKLNAFLKEYELDRLQSMLVHGFSNILMFVFAREKNYPEFIIKINRSGERCLKNEFDILTQFEEKSFLREVVSKPLGYNNNLGVEYFVQSALKGNNLAHLGGIFDRNSLSCTLKRITSELTQFHLFGGEKRFLVDDNKSSQLYQDIERVFVSSGGSDCVLKPYEGKLRNMLFRIKGASIPFVVRHDDFWPGNILQDKSNLGIIDWDRAELEGFPLRDLFDLLLNCSRLIYSPVFKRYAFDNTDLKEYALNAFFGKGITAFAAECMNSYCFSLKLGREIIKPLFLWHMIKKYRDPRLLEFFFKNESNFLKSD